VVPSSVFVIGEFKKGKSSLVNGLIAADACPTPVHLTTEVPTVVLWGPARSAAALWDEGAETEFEMAWDEALALITSPEAPSGRRLSRVLLSTPSDLLEAGCVLVDTPAFGLAGWESHRTNTASLGMADAVIMATDASQEYTATELDVIATSSDAGATLVFVMTKIDFYPDWRRVMGLNQVHLDRCGFDAELLPVSNTLVQVARRRSDEQLQADSGFPRLLEVLASEILRPNQTARSVEDTSS